MSKTLMRRAIDANLPRGSLWRILSDGYLDKYLDAEGDDLELGRVMTQAAEQVRDPIKTQALADLEIDFGVLPDSNISDSARRMYLSAIKGAAQLETGSAAELQERLRFAGFDVYVFKNDPPVDPADYLLSGYLATCGDAESTCGNPEARCGLGAEGDSELIVNGDMISEQRISYTATCGDSESTCVDPDDEDSEDYLTTCGALGGMIRERYYYPLPINPARFKYVWFIAAARTGYVKFNDWNMEHSGVAHWEENDNAHVTKTFDYKADGIRGLLVQQGGALVSDGPYVEQLLDTPVEGTFTVTVTVWDFGTYPPVLMVCDKDGVWDVAGKITGLTAGSSIGYTLTYSATNGVSGVRFYVWGALVGADGQAVFDKLEITGMDFTLATIPIEQRLAFRKLVIKLKPLNTWCALLVDYTEPDEGEPGAFEEDDMTYRTQAITEGGTVWIYESEAAVHIKLIGTTGTETQAYVRFDDAQNFTEGRLYRLTNLTDAEISVVNYDMSYIKILPPDGKMDIHLIDNSSAAGTWKFLTHITGDAAEDV